jgi:hypothetical protein
MYLPVTPFSEVTNFAAAASTAAFSFCPAAGDPDSLEHATNTANSPADTIDVFIQNLQWFAQHGQRPSEHSSTVSVRSKLGERSNGF